MRPEYGAPATLRRFYPSFGAQRAEKYTGGGSGFNGNEPESPGFTDFPASNG